MSSPRFGPRARASSFVRAAGTVLLTCGAWMSTAGAESPPAPAPGTPIVDYIAALRDAGFEVAYSNALLTADMRVREPPRASDALGDLRAVLAPYGLTLEPGPRDLWLVVAAPQAVAPGEAVAAPPAPFEPSPPRLESIVVSASRYEISRAAPESTRGLERAELVNVPALGDDALRATRTLPGLTTSGLSAKFHVRGGATDEAAIYLDGVRLYSPYHFKDFQSLFSGISSRLLDSVDVRTGGYSAELGNGMSGVVEMRTLPPADQRHYEVEASLLTTSLLGSGRFAEGRGGWLSSVRRSNLDFVTDRTGSTIGEPDYSDFFGKLDYTLDSGLTVAAGALFLNDKIWLNDSESASAHADYDDGYQWVSAEHEGARLKAAYLLSRTTLEDGRAGALYGSGSASGRLQDWRRFESTGLKADWTLELSSDRLLRFGAELEQQWARYDFESYAAADASIDVGPLDQPPRAVSTHTTLEGQQQGAYFSYRVRPNARLTAEAGLRWDRQTYLDTSELSPRFNLMFQVGDRGTLRAAWGRFYQAQNPSELQVGDGVTELGPPQRSDQAVLGFDYLLGQAATLRVEAYNKQFERLNPRFDNLYYRLSLLPELLPDRVMISPDGGEATGLELALDGRNGPWSWWLSLARSSVRDLIDGKHVPRSWDEPWSAKAGATWNGPRWTTTVTATAHAGWPTTDLRLASGVLAAGDFNAGRLPTFATLDVKATRHVPLEAGGQLSWFIELDNALDRRNPCCFEYSSGSDIRSFERLNWLPLVPTFGIRWEY